MNIISKYILILAILLFQTSFLSNLAINGLLPNLLIIAVIALFFTENPGDFDSPYLAFFAGALWDLSFSKTFGVATIFFFLMALIAKRLRSMFETGFWFYSSYCLLFFLAYFALEPFMQGYSYNLLFSAQNISRLSFQLFINVISGIVIFVVMDYGFGSIRNKA